VDRATRAQDSAAYKSLNPAGRIPVLETPHGLIFETAAILLWLADRHGKMFPAAEYSERGEALKWLFFISNDIQSSMRFVFYSDRFVGPDPDQQAAFRVPLQNQIGRSLLLLNESLPGRDWALPGPAPSLLDCYLAPILRWTQLYPTLAPGWFCTQEVPKLLQIADAMQKRPSGQKAQNAEGLGPRPFTDPQMAQPPEGSAH
jgi:glutathione S-transferase